MIDFADFQKYSLFGGFQPDDLERIRPLLIQKTYGIGDTVLGEGQRNDTIYFIQQGEVRISRATVELITLPEGECFGEMEILDVMPAAATVQAVSPLTVAGLTNRALHELYRIDPKLFALFMMNLARDLSRRLRRMDERICEDDLLRAV
jgi:CRP/FNR family cyclic AMP-dependent transcriptional regulator